VTGVQITLRFVFAFVAAACCFAGDSLLLDIRLRHPTQTWPAGSQHAPGFSPSRKKTESMTGRLTGCGQ